MSAPLHSLKTVLEMIKFEHTVFALPFAFLGMILAAEGWPAWSTVGWIVLAMVGARSAAMAYNRLTDHQLDTANPRTADRALPQELVSRTFVWLFTLAGLTLLVLAAWKLNPLAFKLSPLAIVIILGYSWTKRFTSLSHLFLGLALSGAPLGAWIAVRGNVTATPLLLAAAVLTWVAGFDVLYALADRDHDRKVGLHSIPAAMGETPALVISAVLHLATLALLLCLPTTYSGLGVGWWVGVAGAAAMLAYQHWIVRPGDLSRLNAAFFTANGVLSIWLFAAAAIDVLA